MIADMSIMPAPALPATGGRIDPATARAIGEEFEAVFLASMMQHMFAGIETDGPFGGGHAEETWRSMLVEEYGKELAAHGGIGIAEEITRELLAFQEIDRHDDQ